MMPPPSPPGRARAHTHARTRTHSPGCLHSEMCGNCCRVNIWKPCRQRRQTVHACSTHLWSSISAGLGSQTSLACRPSRHCRVVKQFQVFARQEHCCCGRSTCASTSGLQTGVVAVWQAEVLRRGGGGGGGDHLLRSSLLVFRDVGRHLIHRFVPSLGAIKPSAHFLQG